MARATLTICKWELLEALKEVQSADVHLDAIPRFLRVEAKALHDEPTAAFRVTLEGPRLVVRPSPRLLALLANLRARGLTQMEA